jgi:hypothetical protein
VRSTHCQRIVAQLSPASSTNQRSACSSSDRSAPHEPSKSAVPGASSDAEGAVIGAVANNRRAPPMTGPTVAKKDSSAVENGVPALLAEDVDDTPGAGAGLEAARASSP